MSAEQVARWLAAHPLSPAHVDCATAVMLKILDGKCKMRPTEKQVMTLLYQQVKDCPGALLGAAEHALIAEAGASPDEAMKLRVYERRVLAETMLARPLMKGFKAMLRERGLLDPRHDQEAAEE